jgi:hypothetical protein
MLYGWLNKNQRIPEQSQRGQGAAIWLHVGDIDRSIRNGWVTYFMVKDTVKKEIQTLSTVKYKKAVVPDAACCLYGTIAIYIQKKL